MFFKSETYGHVIREMERKFPDKMDWWTKLRAEIHPDFARGYEQHAREVLGKSNLYWFP